MEEVTTLTGHKDRVWALAWSGKGDLATASGDGTVKIWRCAEGVWACAQTLSEHSRTVRHVAWAHDGNTLACSSFDSSITIWKRMPDGSFDLVSAIAEAHDNEVKSACFNCEDKLLASCSRDKQVRLWVDTYDENAMDEDHTEKQNQGEYFDCLAVLSGHSQDVKHVLWHPDRPVLVSCSYDDTIKVWQEDPGEPDEWTCTQTLKGHTSTVWQACFSKDGAYMASCSDDRTVIVWQLVAGSDGCSFVKACTIAGEHSRTIFGVDWSATGLIATASADDAVRVFKRKPDGPSGEVGYDLLAHNAHAHLADVNCVRWDPQSDLLASCSDDGTVKIWRLTDAS